MNNRDQINIRLYTANITCKSSIGGGENIEEELPFMVVVVVLFIFQY